MGFLSSGPKREEERRSEDEGWGFGLNGNFILGSNLLADVGDSERGGRSGVCCGGRWSSGSSSSPSSGDEAEGRFCGGSSRWGDAERFVDVDDETSIEVGLTGCSDKTSL